jgi:5-hydroxyisourate hydrolase
MTAKLSTHVLDTYHGGPGAGIAWALEARSASGESGSWTQLAEGVTNADGRTDAPLLEGTALKTGAYRITFQVGAYFAGRGLALPEPPFLDAVVVQVSLQAGEAYHVPLLTSPWSYSTYRGS